MMEIKSMLSIIDVFFFGFEEGRKTKAAPIVNSNIREGSK